MPDERLRDDISMEADKPAPPEPPKRGSKWKTFLLLIFLAMGGVTGLHMGGLIDVRPFIWSVVPKIPFVGEDLKKYLAIPDAYTLTADERRKIELEEWQKRLDAKEREANDKLAQAQALSNDVSARLDKIEKEEQKLRNAENTTKAGDDATEEEKALMNELMKTYQEISPRRAALIMARLSDRLAVELLKKLPPDARASILSKMDAKRAAAITEHLAAPQ